MQGSGGYLIQNVGLIDSDEISLQSNSLLIEINKLLADKNYAKVEEMVHILININSHPKFKLKLAHFLYIQGKSAKAEEIYKELLPYLPDSLKPEALFGLGQAYFDLKLYLESHMTFSLLLNSYNDFKHIFEIYLKLGRISFMLNNSASSIEYIKKIIYNKASSRYLKSEALVLLAQVREKENNIEKAVTAAKRALDVCLTFRSLIADAYFLLRTKPEETEDLCLKSLRFFNDEAEWNDILFFRSVALIKTGECEKAVNILKSQLLTFPQNFLYNEYLGIAYLRIRDFSRSFEVFQRIRESRPWDITNLKNLAYCCKACGFIEEAFHVLEIVFQIEGKRVDIEDLGITEPSFDIDLFPSNV